MSPSLTYFAVYLGLFLALVLGIACNLYLDLNPQFLLAGVLLWSVPFAWSLYRGWAQQGIPSAKGMRQRKLVSVVGAILTVILFLPLFGMPEAGLYVMAALQVAENCTMTTRQHLFRGLLISAGMVIYATMQFQANWSMFFYLIPYIVAVVFTLVAEQISRRVQTANHLGLATSSRRGQGAAITAATFGILSIGLIIYALTPQVTWPFLREQQSLISLSGSSPIQEQGSQDKSATSRLVAIGRVLENTARRLPWNKWPSAYEMRQVSAQTPMPQWQKSAINWAAGLTETLSSATEQIKQRLQDRANGLKSWMDAHRLGVVFTVLMALLFSMFLAAYAFGREVKPVAWARSRIDYLWLGLWATHTPGNRQAENYYQAMLRQFALNDCAPQATWNTQEFLNQTRIIHAHVHRDCLLLTILVEKARYGLQPLSASDIAVMRMSYMSLFNNIPHTSTMYREEIWSLT